jgi:hypothetical protein
LWCYQMCSVYHMCQHDGHPPAFVAPLAVVLAVNPIMAALDQNNPVEKVNC